MASEGKIYVCSVCKQEILVTKAGAGTLVCCDKPMAEKKEAAQKESGMIFSGFQDIIRFAVQREEEAARNYGEMIRRTRSESGRKLLFELQEDEKRHKDILLGLSRKRVEASGAGDVQDLKISDYLAETPLRPDMSFQDLLIHAAQKEKQAVDLYTDLALRATAEDQKKLFQFLAKQELSHKLRLELEYEREVLAED
jgi:desulfoferrodoxin-like iron-binding protein